MYLLNDLIGRSRILSVSVSLLSIVHHTYRSDLFPELIKFMRHSYDVGIRSVPRNNYHCLANYAKKSD